MVDGKVSKYNIIIYYVMAYGHTKRFVVKHSCSIILINILYRISGKIIYKLY